MTIRKSTLRRRFATITLTMSMQKVADGIQIRGSTEVDWESYWPLGLIVLVSIYCLTIKSGGIIFSILGILIIIAYVRTAYFEQKHMIEEVRNIL